MSLPVLILGCGYTGSRAAARLAARGVRVIAAGRRADLIPPHPLIQPILLDASSSSDLESLLPLIPYGCHLLHSLPVLDDGRETTSEILSVLGPALRRIVYLSTTAVYGAQLDIDEHTPAAPQTPEARLRLAAEQAVLAGPWSAIVLRPAAIYGPGRGVHVSIPAGRFRMAGAGESRVSRIHVEDLAALAEAALFSEIRGAWPVADLEPSRQRDIAAFVCSLLGCPMPPSAPPESLHRTLRANRRVDGRAVFRAHGLALQFPSFREGIYACLAAEGRLPPAPPAALQSET
jgi:nucleoside-diphosphate-sugar epimerase